MKQSAPWPERRRRFVHDWLRNQYIMQLGTWIQILDGQVEYEEFEDSFLRSGFPQWQEHLPEAEALIEDFENEMSPRKLFDSPPLCHCGPETRVWLGDVAHRVWKTRRAVPEKIEKCRETLRTTQQLYLKIQASLPLASDVREAGGAFREFRESCRCLAERISDLPREVQPL